MDAGCGGNCLMRAASNCRFRLMTHLRHDTHFPLGVRPSYERENPMKTLLTATALILSLTGAASAADEPKGNDVLAGGPIYAGGQYFMQCYFINFGSANVTPIAQELFGISSTTPLNSASSCANGSAIVPNQTCYASLPAAAPSGPLSCKMTFSGPAKNVRGALELYDSTGNLLSTVELR